MNEELKDLLREMRHSPESEPRMICETVDDCLAGLDAEDLSDTAFVNRYVAGIAHAFIGWGLAILDKTGEDSDLCHTARELFNL